MQMRALFLFERLIKGASHIVIVSGSPIPLLYANNIVCAWTAVRGAFKKYKLIGVVVSSRDFVGLILGI